MNLTAQALQQHGVIESTQVKWLEELPKADLHFHFEGSLPWPVIRALHPLGESLPAKPPWYDSLPFNSFNDFLTIFQNYIRPCLTSEEHYRTAAKHLIHWLNQQPGLQYVEWNVSLKILKDHNLSMQRIFTVLGEVIAAKSEGTLRIVLIAGINREQTLEDKLDLLNNIATIPEIVGIDLHGLENDTDLKDHALFFKEAKELNLKIKVHAGELSGPDNVRLVVEEYGILRICHGVRAVEDDDLLNVLANKQVVLELCPISNIMLQVVPSVESYPFKKLLDSHVQFTLNTDDALLFNTNLLDQYALAMASGLSTTQIEALSRTSLGL